NSTGYGGGGMYNSSSDPILTNCKFSRNSADDYGGGMDNRENSSPTLTNCTFSGNYADIGGGMCNVQNSPSLTNCAFSENSALYSGGMYNYESSPTLTGCIFSSNSAKSGGGMSSVRSSYFSPPLFKRWNLILTNCTFAQNSAQNGNALACDSYEQNWLSNVEIINCIIWDGGDEIWNNDGSTIMITYSNVQGGFPGEGNIDVDPLFAQPGYWADVNDPNIVIEPNDPNAVWIDGDYHLKSEAGRWDPNSESWVVDDVTSPCIDAGD
ncbi:unnamed protein product, partial [marine sediment metagenome]